MTQLFDTDRAENVRKALHKKAYASYRAYEFLKAGIKAPGKPQEPALSAAKKRLQETDPYNFPELDQTVNTVLAKDILTTQLLDNGEQINVPGRRFKGYTD